MIGVIAAALFSLPSIISGTVAPQPHLIVMNGCSGNVITPRKILTSWHCSATVGDVAHVPGVAATYLIITRENRYIAGSGNQGIAVMTVDRDMARQPIPIYIGGQLTNVYGTLTYCGHGLQGDGLPFPRPASCADMWTGYRWLPHWVFSHAYPQNVQGGDSGGSVKFGKWLVGVIYSYGTVTGDGGSFDDLSWSGYRDFLLTVAPEATYIRGLALVPRVMR